MKTIKGISTTLLCIAGIIWPMFVTVGCARFTTQQTDVSYELGQKTREVTTKASALTFIEAKSSLANFKASQTDKTQGATVGSLNQAADAGTNVANLAEAIARGVTSGLK